MSSFTMLKNSPQCKTRMISTPSRLLTLIMIIDIVLTINKTSPCTLFKPIPSNRLLNHLISRPFNKMKRTRRRMRMGNPGSFKIFLMEYYLIQIYLETFQ